MNDKKIVALEVVHEDLDKEEAFYDAVSPGIGSYCRTSLISDMESLMLFAGIHEKHYGYYRMLSKRFPYAIYYDIKDEIVIVVAVLGLKRNPSFIQRNMKNRGR